MRNLTPRKHPRTLNEAFPQDAAEWFEGPLRREGMAYKLVLWSIYALIAVVLLKFFN
jgi:hypothetical protein